MADTMVGATITDGMSYKIIYERWIGWYWMPLPEDGDHALQGPFKTADEAMTDYLEHIYHG